jgi:hypothetical protein
MVDRDIGCHTRLVPQGSHSSSYYELVGQLHYRQRQRKQQQLLPCRRTLLEDTGSGRRQSAASEQTGALRVGGGGGARRDAATTARSTTDRPADAAYCCVRIGLLEAAAALSPQRKERRTIRPGSLGRYWYESTATSRRTAPDPAHHEARGRHPAVPVGPASSPITLRQSTYKLRIFSNRPTGPVVVPIAQPVSSHDISSWRCDDARSL